MKKVRVGIIGCGNIAGWFEKDEMMVKPCTHMGAYRIRKDVDVVGCCDMDIKRAKEFAQEFKAPFYTDSIKELLAQKINILSICVPYRFNLQVIQSIVRLQNKPKVIFLEKPISNSLIHAKKIVELCNRANIKLYVNNRRLALFYQTVKKLIKENFKDEVISASGWCSSGMHAIGTHMIDLLRYIFGEVDWVFATQEKAYIEKLPYSDNFTADDPRFSGMIGFKSGLQVAFFNSAKTDFTYFELEVLCKTGRVRAADNGNKIVYQRKLKPGKSTLSYRLGQEKEIAIKSKSLFKLLINEIMEGDYRKSLINGYEALKSYAVIDAMSKSAKSNKVYYLK